MASRNLSRGESQEHENAEARLAHARENRDAVSTSANGGLEASVELEAADEQVAAREAWVKWVERDY